MIHFAGLLTSRRDEGERKKTKAAFVRLIASLATGYVVLRFDRSGRGDRFSAKPG
jgi:hypothetical protein